MAQIVLNSSQADASHALGQQLSVLNAASHHFHSMKRQHDHREKMLANPAAGDLDIQLDFKENVTVPLGPEHAQDWFWATARRSITTLGFCVTHLSAERRVVTHYFHDLTYILDHSQLFAALALKDLLRRLGLPGAPFQRLHVWADCGTHFRGYLFLWELRSVCLEFGLAVAVLHLYAEHHGKGRCDGQFGLQRRWTDEWAEKHVIKNLEDLIQACRAGAQAAMRSDAPPVGPSYEIVHFNPAKPSEAFGLDEKAADFMIEYTLHSCPQGSDTGVGRAGAQLCVQRPHATARSGHTPCAYPSPGVADWGSRMATVIPQDRT